MASGALFCDPKWTMLQEYSDSCEINNGELIQTSTILLV